MLDLRRFRTHVEILRHRHPELITKLIPDRKKSPVRILEGPAGLTLKWHGKLLHSAKDPEGEARRILDKVSFRNGHAYVVFGLGLGHMAFEAHARLPENASLILLEPDIRILREVLSAVDFRALLFDDRVRLVSGRDWHDPFRTVLRHCHDEGRRPASSILALPSYRSYLGRAYDAARHVLAQYLNEREIDTNTRKRLWDLWNENLVKNIPEILTSAPLRNFTTTFHDIPALLVGAGPSLDENLTDLERLREGSMVIAVDTALGPLLSAGCVPDVVLAMDAQEENATDFSGLPDHSTTLVFDGFCYPSIPKSYPAKCRIASFTGHIFPEFDRVTVLKNALVPLLEYLADLEFGFLQNGGSVITAGFDLARLAGCSALGVLGVDLSYPGFRTHSKLTRRSGKRYTLQTRFSTAEWDFYEEFSQKARLRLDSAAGGKVWSDRVLVMYKQWMEDSAQKAGLPCFAVGKTRGLVLTGYTPVTAPEFLSKYGAPRKEIETRLGRCRNNRPPLNVKQARDRLAGIRKDMAALDGPEPDRIGPFELEDFIRMASSEISDRLTAVMAVEPEPQHAARRGQAARAARKFVTPFLDAFESALEKI